MICLHLLAFTGLLLVLPLPTSSIIFSFQPRESGEFLSHKSKFGKDNSRKVELFADRGCQGEANLILDEFRNAGFLVNSDHCTKGNMMNEEEKEEGFSGKAASFRQEQQKKKTWAFPGAPCGQNKTTFSARVHGAVEVDLHSDCE